ncbi:DUF3768 domain-containing protein [Devosia sp.]|uniref:DUF3768 domain-containing protein n=1 Tax=Devosia sp. TaxID=1871048 RepID=UPI0032650ABA
MQPDETSEAGGTIRSLNDALRMLGLGGSVVMTPGVGALSEVDRSDVVAAIRAFDAFTQDNDPYGEHDCAAVAVGDLRVIWKIDYYDRTLSGHSLDAADTSVTVRILTIMLADEY